MSDADASLAYMASPGNHEADCQEIPYTSRLCPTGQKNFTDFQNRFGRTMPSTFPSQSTSKSLQANAKKAAALANPPFWFSFEYGMAHVVMFDTETDFKNAPDGTNGSAHLDTGRFGFPGQQTAFLRADLASVNRTQTPWLIVAGHRPWYALGDEQCGPCQNAFETIFYQAGVDLAIFGHVHNSQRFAPMYQGKVDPAGYNNPKAPAYIIAGGAGNIEGLSTYSSNATGNVFAYDEDFSYATLQFKDSEHLGIQFLRSSTGELLDSSVLYKKRG